MTQFPFAPSYASLLDITPAAVEKYLRTTGWEMTREQSGLLSMWRHTEARASLMLPLDREFDDYADRFADALAVLGRIRNVAGEPLALEIASASSDIMFLRADQYSSDGTIPLREAENLLLGARKMLTAAALSAVSPKANFGPARPAAVKDFIQDDVRMGHTLHGSFVITVLARLDDEDISESPTPDVTEPPLADSPELSFQRRVMTTLATGLSAASEMLRGNGAPDINVAVEAGVSAQLIDSLAEISSFEGVRAIESSFRWSPGHAAVPDETPDFISLPRVNKARIQEVRERLKKRPDPDLDQIIGQVVRLERAEKDATGVAVVDGYVGKQRKRVRVELAPSAYAQATTAHEKRQPVVVEGSMTFTKGSYRIENPRSFRDLDTGKN